jgi:predicted nuclease with TOPRIM domain
VPAGSDGAADQPKLKMNRLANMRAQGKSKKAPSQTQGGGAAANKELKQLQTSLSIAQAEIEALRWEKSQLEERLSRQEAQVRMEIARDMDEQMQIMRGQYKNIINNFKSQIHSTPSKSVKKAQMDKADSIMDELMDKVD